MAEDPRVIAQRGVNPLTGSYLSKRERIAMFRSVNVSSSAFGGGGGGRGLVRSSAAIVPQTTAIVRRNEQDIGTLSDSVRVIAAKVQDLGGTVNTVANSVTKNQLLEAEKARQENKQEEQLANEALRTGREDELEKKLQSSLLKPVQAIISRAQGIFERIKTALGFLLGGWLTKAGIALFDARRKGLTKRFEELKKNLRNSLIQIGAVLLAATLGFGILGRILSRLAFKIAGLSAKILLLPFRALSRLGLNLLRRLPGFSRATVTGTQGARLTNTARNVVGGGARVTTSGGRVVQGGARVTGAVAQTGAKVGMGRLAAGSLPILGALVDGFAAIQEAGRGNWQGAGLFLASAGASFLPGKGTLASIPLTAAAIAQSATWKGDAIEDPKIEPLAEAAAEGKTTLSPESIQPTAKSSMADLGPLQEMAPEAVLIPQQSQIRDSSRPDSSIGFDTPQIPSSNTDNFYTMYSKLVYNVVD
jgi:hypothetical protein